MTDLATRTLAPIINATATKIGAPLPKAVTAALADVARLRDAQREGIANGPNLSSAVAEAILSGRDPLASKDVARAALSAQLESLNIGARLTEHSHALSARVILDHADAVIETWRPAVERADAALREFREAAPGAALDLTDPVAQLPARALTPWGAARDAVGALEQIGQAWQALATAGAASVPHNGRPLIFAALTAEELDTLGSNAKPIAAANVPDVVLDLADLATYAERVASVQDRRQAREDYAAAAPERAREERRQLMAIRIPGGAA